VGGVFNQLRPLQRPISFPDGFRFAFHLDPMKEPYQPVLSSLTSQQLKPWLLSYRENSVLELLQVIKRRPASKLFPGLLPALLGPYEPVKSVQFCTLRFTSQLGCTAHQKVPPVCLLRDRIVQFEVCQCKKSHRALSALCFQSDAD